MERFEEARRLDYLMHGAAVSLCRLCLDRGLVDQARDLAAETYPLVPLNSVLHRCLFDLNRHGRGPVGNLRILSGLVREVTRKAAVTKRLTRFLDREILDLPREPQPPEA